MRRVRILMWGQSNMEGADSTVNLTSWVTDPTDLDSKVYHWTPSTGYYWHPLAPYRDTSGRFIHGPEIGLVRTLQQYLPGRYIIAKATGNIAPSEPKYLWSTTEAYGLAAIECFRQACLVEGVPPHPDAIISWQGIDDANNPIRLPQYIVLLQQVIVDYRAHYGNNLLPYIVCHSVNSPLPPPAAMASVRSTQLYCANWLPRVTLASPDSLPLTNYHHLTSPAQLSMGGTRIALPLLNSQISAENNLIFGVK